MSPNGQWARLKTWTTHHVSQFACINTLSSCFIQASHCFALGCVAGEHLLLSCQSETWPDLTCGAAMACFDAVCSQKEKGFKDTYTQINISNNPVNWRELEDDYEIIEN
jgi:hypothetical protein